MGFLLFYDWFDLFQDLSPKHFKLLLCAMIDYQREGIEPPEFPDKIKKIAKLIFAQLDRRLKNAENGRRGGVAKARRKNEGAGEKLSPMASRFAAAEDSPAAENAAYRKDKTRQDENSQDESKQNNKYLLSDESAYLCGSGEPQIANCDLPFANEDAETRNTHAKREKEDFFEEEEAEDRKAYGKHKNVFLSDGEYNILKKNIPNADNYINAFSEKLFSKGYRYRDHYAALLSWWDRDKEYALREPGYAQGGYGSRGGGDSGGGSNSQIMSDEYFEEAAAKALGMTLEEYRKSCENENPSNGSFDTDSFFDAAVRRALKDD